MLTFPELFIVMAVSYPFFLLGLVEALASAPNSYQKSHTRTHTCWIGLAIAAGFVFGGALLLLRTQAADAALEASVSMSELWVGHGSRRKLGP